MRRVKISPYCLYIDVIIGILITIAIALLLIPEKDVQQKKHHERIRIVNIMEVEEQSVDSYAALPPLVIIRELNKEELMMAQLVEAEAGNQDLTGKRLVISVILNRVKDPRFPDSIPEVIFQENQFGPISDGRYQEMEGRISEESIESVRLELNDQINNGILYFNTSWDNGINPFKYGDHYFSY